MPTPMGRNQGPRSEPADSLREEPQWDELREKRELRLLYALAPTDAQLVDAAEQADAGIRLAVPRLLDQTERLPISDVPVEKVELETADRLLLAAAEFHDSHAAELQQLGESGPADRQFAALQLGEALRNYLKVAMGDGGEAA